MVPSPCINVCRMNEQSGLCEGCSRTLDEIAIWGQASDPQKLAILAQVARRRAVPGSSASSPDCD
jgi:uncharacterized protein